MSYHAMLPYALLFLGGGGDDFLALGLRLGGGEGGGLRLGGGTGGGLRRGRLVALGLGLAGAFVGAGLGVGFVGAGLGVGLAVTTTTVLQSVPPKPLLHMQRPRDTSHTPFVEQSCGQPFGAAMLRTDNNTPLLAPLPLHAPSHTCRRAAALRPISSGCASAATRAGGTT